MKFEFADLIAEYSLPFKLISKGEGYHDQDNGGRWVEGEGSKTDEEGILVPLPSKLVMDSGGTLTTKDRLLIITKAIPLKAECDFQNASYTVFEETDWNDYADFYKYVLKHSSQKK